MKRILLPAALLLALAVPMQSASAAQKKHKDSTNEDICQSSTDGLVTQKCKNHMRKMKNIGIALSDCLDDLNAEYLGETGNGAGKWNNYIAQQKKCMGIAQQAMDALTDAYVPGGDTSVRRQLRKSIKKMKARIARAEEDKKKAGE